MHPDLLGALARLHDRELLRPAEFRQPDDPWRPHLGARDALRRARTRVGGVLVDLGVHLMLVT
ncbi:MAG TPA: hypothetical protein VND62_00660 [Acidimicrobiales bacterium]|nr:hypothetical protein [Acidimicrobiales bacterium]